MSITTTNVCVPAGATTIYALVNAVETLATNVGHWFSARATSSALARSSDSQLNDLGLFRGNF